jgi:ATP-dependent exoDNAse (exonuclease V) beta subunit
LHCLLLDAESFNKQFILSSGSVPTGPSKQVVDRVFRSAVEQRRTDEPMSSFQSEILDILREINFHQRLKTDEQRIEKILTEDTIAYFEFLKNRSGKDIIDEDMYNRAKESVEIIRNNKMATDAIEGDSVESEVMLNCTFEDYPFGIKGIVDRIIRNGSKITICDLKTTNKTISDFADTVQYYNYWLQAAIYVELVACREQINPVEIDFKFLVIDKYQQVYVFNVEKNSMLLWRRQLKEKLDVAKYHYDNRYYALPYEFATGKITL